MLVEKLNKGKYVLEDEKIITNGKWEGYLDHDNADYNSISVYTGSKFTGNKVDNYFISTPSEAPWKAYLKVYSDSEKVYITYESTGDQVEAEDINQLQDVLVEEITRSKDIDKNLDTKISKEIARAANSEDTLSINLSNEITRAKGKELELENKKANITYVDTELLKKYDKNQVYTKEEVLQKIEDLIGAAPETLDTLAEIAEALNHDPNFAATMINELSKKVNKVVGKGLSDENYTAAEKSKLAGIVENANNYIHPASHPASMITGLPTTLPANGGNADKLDNQNSAYYTNIKARLGYTPANIAGDTFKGNVKMQQLSGDLVAALVTEVNGQLIDFGTNFTQSGSKDTTKDGGLFRIDARDGFPLFNVLYQPAGGAEQVLFSVDKDGTIYQGNKAHKIWHEGNDGSSSGLDADKVDGKDASAFANVSHTHDDRYFMYKNLTKSDGTMAAIGSADLNTITDTGFYFKNTTDNLNQPISNWGTLLVYKYDTTRIVQIFIPDDVSTMHVRPYNGAWMGWREMNGGGVVGPVTWNDLKGV